MRLNLYALTVKNLNPTVESNPAKHPITTAPQGFNGISAVAPTATPPARVAF
jgi:hypothetical protein